ncbi:MAG: hypothetical protein PVJ39_16550 [Gammaproteobacteria bacterium]|jgi:hypothetical protein
MDDYLEDVLDEIDFNEELMTALDDRELWEEHGDFPLLLQPDVSPDPDDNQSLY